MIARIALERARAGLGNSVIVGDVEAVKRAELFADVGPERCAGGDGVPQARQGRAVRAAGGHEVAVEGGERDEAGDAGFGNPARYRPGQVSALQEMELDAGQEGR